MARRIVGLAIAAVGVAFLVLLLVDNLFTVGPAFERMSDGFRPIMKPAALAVYQGDLNRLGASGKELTTAMPKLAVALGTTPAELNAQIGQQYPAVAAGMKALPATLDSFQGVLNTVKAERSRFAQADAIPTASLPATTVPWAVLAAGIILVLVGLAVAFTSGLAMPIAAVVVGAALVAAPLAMSLPGKASAADTMNANLKPVYTAQMVSGAQQSLKVMGAMGTQLQTDMIPAIGAQLGLTQPQLQAFLQQTLPATATAMQTMPATMGRFEALVSTFRTHLSDYNAITNVSLVPAVWTLIVGGAVVMLAGLAGMLWRRPRRVEVARPIEVPRAA